MSQPAVPDLFVSVARQCLASGKKRKCLSMCECRSLAAQIQAVDLGLKPALLYDLNSAEPSQIQHYLRCLQAAGRVSKALHLLVMDGNVIIINLDVCILSLEELLRQNTVVLMDVSWGNAQPATADFRLSGMEASVRGVLDSLRTLMSDDPLICVVDTQTCASWNLCSLFGILLGYPAVYWFDLIHNAENCLGMVPLQVIRVTACWEAVARGNRCCLYSFSIPEELVSETQSALDTWCNRLRAQFSQQSAFSELAISTDRVCLPHVAL
ncbi:UPF0739 protein C1orf74 homolog [Paramormyrops kingsleyae]|uniref:UPF0739 protein C1orf74 homolog n=1 Tax=Paramormyrops kingsleyae TaxID=1676925 RepID=UPI000CD64D1A|nr:UPF0739 protein C1orf74 homolog [Paramormyrops kingsleyae]XP_023669251.1 UPF0739 protein C1orf74 homolog [Paramormyrops kingsleyae]